MGPLSVGTRDEMGPLSVETSFSSDIKKTETGQLEVRKLGQVNCNWACLMK